MAKPSHADQTARSSAKYSTWFTEMKRVAAFALLLALTACAGVRPEDTAAWVGQPVSALEQQPVFLTMHLVKTRTSDGTEIWDYVNGAAVSSCSGNGQISGDVSMATFNSFSSCMARVASCNNLFYVKDGRVERYVPVGTGGARCYTNDAVRPGFAGPVNYH